MAKLTEIFRGLYIGIWNFCFPDNERRERQRQLEYVVRRERLEWSSYHCLDRGVADVQSLESPLIVTLTSHGKRLLSVHRVIENLFQQSLLPNQVVLYLGEEEYQSVAQLPIVLQRQIARGLEVRFVRDLRSYTKLIPALREFPDALLITVDDDIYYPVNFIERLVNAHRAHPEAICSLVNRTLSLQPDGSVRNYNELPFDTVSPVDVTSPFIIPEGFGGILYPPHCFTPEVFNEKVFMQLAPTADDLWFKAMSLLAGTPVVKVHSYFDFLDEFIEDQDVQDVGLRNENLKQDKNNAQFKVLFDHYNLYQYLHD